MIAALDRVSAWLLRRSVRLAAPEQQQWAAAMCAELPHAESQGERFRWSLGCSLFLFRQWLRRSLGFRRESAPEGVRMNRPVLAVLITCAVLIGFLLCLPAFREGLGVASTLVSNSLRDPRGFGVSEAKLQRLAAKAEDDHNANLMAFLALRSAGEAAIVRAQRAVSVDRNLTWIYSIVCASYPESSSAACSEMIHQLQAWDGSNSVPYLVEAHRLARMSDPRSRYPGVIASDPAWRQAMASAFNAERYDTYEDRLATLNRNLYFAGSGVSLTDFNDGLLINLRMPDLDQVAGYAPSVLSSNPQALVDFADRVQAGASTAYDQMLASQWALEAYERENRDKPGTVPALQVAAEKRLSELGLRQENAFFPLLDPLAMTFQLTVLVLALSVVALVLLPMSAGVYRMRRGSVPHVLQVLESVAAVILGSSAVTMLLIYRPYSELIHGMLDGSMRTGSIQPWIFASLYHPAFWDGFVPVLWEGVLVLCGIALAVVTLCAPAWRRNHALKAV